MTPSLHEERRFVARKTSLFLPLFSKVSESSEEGKWSCMCMLGNLEVFCFYDFLTRLQNCPDSAVSFQLINQKVRQNVTQRSAVVLKICVTSEAGNGTSSGTHDFILGFQWVSCCLICSFLQSIRQIIVCLFVFYSLFWPLHCLFFFALRFLNFDFLCFNATFSNISAISW